MRKLLALAMLALNPAFAGAGVGSFTTWLYSGTDTGSVFQQYCYTNGALCVITDRADRVARKGIREAMEKELMRT